MKKILAYTLTAVLLGIVTMMAPLGLFAGKVDEKDGMSSTASHEARKTPSEDVEKLYGLQLATCPFDMFFIVFMFASSFALALGFMRYSKKKTAF